MALYWACKMASEHSTAIMLVFNIASSPVYQMVRKPGRNEAVEGSYWLYILYAPANTLMAYYV